MVEVPEFWWNRKQEGGYEYIYISDKETELTPNKSEKFYIGRYTATGNSSAVTCKSGATYLKNISITNLRAAAKNIGKNWRNNRYTSLVFNTNALFSRIC